MKIDSAEYSEWMAYHNIEPFTLSKADHILSVIASILANVHRKKGSRTYKSSDFMPSIKAKRLDTPKEIETKLRSIFSGNNK